jgi:hypothetical protein
MDRLKTKLIRELEEGSKTAEQLQAAIPISSRISGPN